MLDGVSLIDTSSQAQTHIAHAPMLNYIATSAACDDDEVE